MLYPAESKTFCCGGGRNPKRWVREVFNKDMPADLLSLYTAKPVQQNSRRLNNLFCFTCLGECLRSDLLSEAI